MAIKFTKPQSADTGDTIPAGIVVLWPSSEDVPSGWTKCDGTNGTVDMRGYYPRGTPSGDTVNRTYSAATHTHTAAHDHTTQDCAHTHTVAAHTHCMASHTHDMKCHTHCMNSHVHCMANHVHDMATHVHCMANHCHCGPAHTHGVGSLCYDTISHSVSTCKFLVCAGGSDAVTAVCDHPSASLEASGVTDSDGTGDTGTNNDPTGVADPADTGGNNDNTCGPDPTDTCGPSDNTSDTPSVSDTCSGGGGNTGSHTIQITVDSCDLTTSAGSSLPPTRNVDYIMKL